MDPRTVWGNHRAGPALARLAVPSPKSPYRMRIRTPSFAHMQMISYISKGYTVADLLSSLGAMDYVLADIDR